MQGFSCFLTFYWFSRVLYSPRQEPLNYNGNYYFLLILSVFTHGFVCCPRKIPGISPNHWNENANIFIADKVFQVDLLYLCKTWQIGHITTLFRKRPWPQQLSIYCCYSQNSLFCVYCMSHVTGKFILPCDGQECFFFISVSSCIKVLLDYASIIFIYILRNQNANLRYQLHSD